jgi:hypothetical protein
MNSCHALSIGQTEDMSVSVCVHECMSRGYEYECMSVGLSVSLSTYASQSHKGHYFDGNELQPRHIFFSYTPVG